LFPNWTGHPASPCLSGVQGRSGRLHHGDDRLANNALLRIALVRMHCHQSTTVVNGSSSPTPSARWWWSRVMAASVQDRNGAKTTLLSAYLVTPIRFVFADAGFAGRLVDWTAAILRTVLHIVRKPEGQEGFVVIPRLRTSLAAASHTAPAWACTAGSSNRPLPCCTGYGGCESGGRSATTFTRRS
jgi:hypothetical protein